MPAGEHASCVACCRHGFWVPMATCRHRTCRRREISTAPLASIPYSLSAVAPHVTEEALRQPFSCLLSFSHQHRDRLMACHPGPEASVQTFVAPRVCFTESSDEIQGRTYFSNTTPSTSSTSPASSPRPVNLARQLAAVRSDSVATTISMSPSVSASLGD
jgi:hypothetical protein